MPRNDQMIRQWLLLQQLERPRGATLQELAGSLPDDYHKHLRTIRRDLDALGASGFPVVTDRAGGRTRWRLIEGYRHTPALTFSPTELMALTLSRHLLKPLEGTQIQASLDSALSKASAALPPPGLAYVKQLQDLFSVGLGPHKTYRQHRATIDRLTRAITQARTVQMRYYSASHNTPPGARLIPIASGIPPEPSTSLPTTIDGGKCVSLPSIAFAPSSRPTTPTRCPSVST